MSTAFRTGIAALALATLFFASPDHPRARDGVPQTIASATGTEAFVPLFVMGETGKLRLEVEIADDVEERARGLMFREHLPAGRGMLFIYPSERFASFWMKNTLIPLDMLFIDRSGQILQIVENTEPHSLTPVRSTEKVIAVLEIGGGRARALGIEVGDRVALGKR